MTMLEDFIEALQKITEASGPFKRDPHDHCRACLQEAQATAVRVLRKHAIQPRREDDVLDGEHIPQLTE